MFAAAALAFMLPFGTVSCDGSEVSFTSVELATYQVDADASSAELRDDVEWNGWLALAALAASLAGLAFGVAGRRGGGVCAALGVLAMQLLFLSGDASLAVVGALLMAPPTTLFVLAAGAS
jgi:hypothetical protein